MLLSCATLFYQSFREVLLGSPGFRTDHLLLLSFDPALVRYTPEKADRFYRALGGQRAKASGSAECGADPSGSLRHWVDGERNRSRR